MPQAPMTGSEVLPRTDEIDFQESGSIGQTL